MAPRKRAASRSPSPQRTPEPPFHFPTVRRGEALFDSYTYHSVDEERTAAGGTTVGEGKGKGRAQEDAEGEQGAEEVSKVEGEWMLGVDEAGRGPALGTSSKLLGRGDSSAEGMQGLRRANLRFRLTS